MSIRTSVARLGSRYLRAMRALSPAAIALTIGLVLGGAGLADAATGGNFILGRANHETTESNLTSTTGTALKLSAPANKAPLAVNRSVMVNNLNAQFLGGQSLSGLQATGGDGYTKSIALNTTDTEVASTGLLKAGEYYATATSLLDVNPSDGYGFCFIDVDSGGALNYGGADPADGYVSASETAIVKVSSGSEVQEWCYAGGDTGTSSFNAGITAIRIASSSGTAPAAPSSASRPRAGNRPGSFSRPGR